MFPKWWLNTLSQLSTCLGFLSWLPTWAVITPLGFNILIIESIFLAARSIQNWSSLRSTKIWSYVSSSTDLILSKASPQTHFTEFFSVAFFPISPRCLLQTSTTSGSNSNQSTKLKSLEIHSLATPPSPPPIMAALSLFLFKLRP